MSCCGGKQPKNNNSVSFKLRKFISKLPIIIGVFFFIVVVYYSIV